MAVEIRKIEPTKKELTKYVKYPIDVLYRDSKCYVPALISDEVGTLMPDKNPAFEFCESAYFMAYRDGKPVGRIAAIINHRFNESHNKKEGRFGWVDFIDDDEVVDALFDAARQWNKEKGMTEFTGPLGFTDMDPEGCLVMGFDEVGTNATIYNYDYYPRQLERMGFVKDVDWVEFHIKVPDAIPEKMQRISDIVKKRFNVDNIKYTNRKQLVADYGQAIFKLINEAFEHLFGYSQLSEKQIEHYIKMYLPYLPLEDLSLIIKNDTRELIGVGIAIPSLSKALIKNRGRLFPFGWYHMLKAFKKNDTVDLLLVAVKPEYQSKGVNSLLFTDLLPCFFKLGYKWAESSHELEHNEMVQKQWQYFDTTLNKRRRAYTMPI